jgi:hypothetical protein
MLNDILSAVNGNNGGPRMQGFQDTRTGQYAALPGAAPANIGTTGNSITAGALPATQIASAVGTAAGRHYTAPKSNIQAPAAAQKALDGQYDAQMQVAGNRNATALGRTAGAQNAQLGRESQMAAASQGIANAGILADQNSQNTANDISRRNPLLRLGGRIAGLA